MRRTDTNPRNVRKMTECHVSSAVNSSSKGINKSLNGNNASGFQTLVENCGFQVIREDDEGNSYCHYESDQSQSSSNPTTTTCQGRWSTETCLDSNEQICYRKPAMDSRTESEELGTVLDSDNNQQKPTTQETYLVARKYGNVTEPTVDYLDMTGIGHSAEGNTQNVDSRLGKRDKKCRCSGSAAVPIKHNSQRMSDKSDKLRSQEKLMKQDVSNMKSRSRGDGNKSLSLANLNNRGVRLQSKISNDFFVENTEHQAQTLNVLDLKVEAEKTNCRISSSRFGDACKQEKHGQSVMKQDEYKRCKNNDIINNVTSGSGQRAASSKCVPESDEITSNVPESDEITSNVPESDEITSNVPESDEMTSNANTESIQAFSNINSSCLRPASDHENNIPTPNSCEEGGMVSYLRKLNIRKNSALEAMKCKHSRGQPKDTCPNQYYPSDRRSSNLVPDSMIRQPEVLEKHCTFNKGNKFFISSTKMAPVCKPKSPVADHWVESRQKASSKVLKLAPRMSRTEHQQSSAERTTSGECFTFSKESNKTPASSMNTDENQDCNINFNSDDGCEEDPCPNSFIGHYLYELWKNQCLCDVRLKVGNTSFLAHKVVLAAFSDLFCPEEPQQIPTLCFEIPGICEEALCLILQYLYTSEMEITDSIMEAVYIAACVLEIAEVTDLITEILSKPTVDNFEKYMEIRSRVGLSANVMDIYSDFVSENLLDLEDSPFILNMPLSQMEKLLRDPDVKIESEEDIIRLIIKWVKYSPCQRSKQAADLLCLVNFDCISPHVLSSIVECNRHLLDLASMDILMAAFKDYALRCKDAPMCQEPPCCKPKHCLPKCNSNSYSPRSSRFKDEESCKCPCPEIYECQEVSPQDCCRENQSRARKCTVVSPQDIRKCAGRSCWEQEKICCKPCCQGEPNKRPVKPNKTNCETKYTIRNKKAACDSSNNFPSECSDQRSCSASSDCRCGQFCGRANFSRSNSDTGQPKPTCYCTQNVHYVRKRTLPPRTGNNNCESVDANEKGGHECSSNFVARDRVTFGGKGNGRSSNNCQMCRQSRSSSRSSGSSQRCNNASSTGSSKRVTFS